MSTSQVPAILDGLVTAFGAVVTGTSGTLGPRAVVDGPTPEAENAKDVVFVGFGGDPADLVSVDTTEAFAGLGAGRKAEMVTVRCAVVCWSGDDQIRALRLAAYVTFGLVQTALRADLTVGRPNPTIGALTSTVLVQESGRRVRLPFTVTVTTRI